MTKPIDAVAAFVAQAVTYCPYVRPAPVNTWKCGLINRATGGEPCLKEDWPVCKLNNGGGPAKTLVEVLS